MGRYDKSHLAFTDKSTLPSTTTRSDSCTFIRSIVRSKRTQWTIFLFLTFLLMIQLSPFSLSTVPRQVGVITSPTSHLKQGDSLTNHPANHNQNYSPEISPGPVTVDYFREGNSNRPTTETNGTEFRAITPLVKLRCVVGHWIGEIIDLDYVALVPRR